MEGGGSASQSLEDNLHNAEDAGARSLNFAIQNSADTYSGGDTADAVDYAIRNVTEVMNEKVESSKRDLLSRTAAEDANSEEGSSGNKTGIFTSWVKNISGVGDSSDSNERSSEVGDGSRSKEEVPVEVRGSVEQRAAALVEDLRTPTDLTSNFSTERQLPSTTDVGIGVPDTVSIQRNNSVESSVDPGERAARTSMIGTTEAQDALL